MKVLSEKGEAISERYYHYDSEGNIVSETKSDNGHQTTDVRYVRDNSGKAISMIQGTNTYYFTYNAHGDVTSLTDEQGNTVATYTYDEFGNTTSSTGTIYNPLRYSDANNAYYDSETGLYKMGARYYDSSTGRWITRDDYKGEQEEPPSQNRYVYVQNDPINGVDPTGYWYGWPEHYRQTKRAALQLGFSWTSAVYMASMNVYFDWRYNAVIRPFYHFGRLTARRQASRAYRSTIPWKYKYYRRRDYRAFFGRVFLARAVFWKHTYVGYQRALKNVAYGVHAIQDIYAHLDATPYQHLRGIHKDHYDEPKARHRGKRWHWWRRGRSERATKNYLSWFKRSIF